MINYNYIVNDTIKHYLGDKFHWPPNNHDNLNIDQIYPATTVDEYLVSLIKGYMNATIDDRLERYLVEQIKDEWFHQWPLIRWSYATRLLYKPKLSKKDIKCAVGILEPMSEDGYPCAIGDMAYCYRYGIGVEQSYEKAICLWVMASRGGYYKAHDCLKLEYDLSWSKELAEELRLLLVNRVLWIFIEEHNLRVVNNMIYNEDLSECDNKTLTKIFNEHKRLCKAVQKKAYLRHCGRLCWSSEDNPYNIGIKVKER
jgi:TPR repeat protein